MSLSDLSIKNPVFAVMLSAAMIVFGYLGYRGMGVSQFPEIDFPVVSGSQGGGKEAGREGADAGTGSAAGNGDLTASGYNRNGLRSKREWSSTR